MPMIMTDNIFQSINAQCGTCLDTTLWRNVSGKVEFCPQSGRIPHQPRNAAAVRLMRAVTDKQSRGEFIDARVFDVARILTHYSSHIPCSRSLIEDIFFDMFHSKNHKIRTIFGWIETLRADWLLPIGSRKYEPHGYWIITDPGDFIIWQKENMSAALTQLKTNYRVFRKNFPVMAGQKEFDFQAVVKAHLDEVLFLEANEEANR